MISLAPTELLLKFQVKADLTLKDASGGTVLHAAALMGLLDLLLYRMAGKKRGSEVSIWKGVLEVGHDGFEDVSKLRVSFGEFMFCSFMM